MRVNNSQRRLIMLYPPVSAILSYIAEARVVPGTLGGGGMNKVEFKLNQDA